MHLEYCYYYCIGIILVYNNNKTKICHGKRSRFSRIASVCACIFSIETVRTQTT